jgi:hypothetical protein
MPDKIRSKAKTFAQTGDRKIDAAEARQLIDAAKDGPGVTASEKKELGRVLERYDSSFTPEGRAELQGFLGMAPAPAPPVEDESLIAFYKTRESRWASDGPVGVRKTTRSGAALPSGVTDMAPIEAYREVYLSARGELVTSPSSDGPRNLQETGDGLYRAAHVIDDVKGNLFLKGEVPLKTRELTFANLVSALDQVPAGGTPPAGLDEKQATQLRSSGATVLLELVTSLGNEGAEASLKGRAFERYAALAGAETNPVLRESMVYNLSLQKDALAPAQRVEADRLLQTIAPLAPPYEKWFADGNKAVNVDLAVGHGFRGHKELLEHNGFRLQPGSADTYTKTMKDRRGEETTFNIRLRELRRDMFENLDETKGSHIVVYDGHSDWGRNVRSSLEASRAQGTGDGKVALVGLCAGKGELNMIRDRFPDAQVVTTYNSSYFGPDEANMKWSENFSALMTTLRGVAERKGWQQIAADVRNEVVRPNRYWHAVDNNYVFPTDTLVRKRVLDSDHDGQADVFDKFVDFNTHDVPGDTRNDFTAHEPARPARSIVGTVPHLAVQTINRLSLYSEVLEPLNNTGRVVGDGYYQPEPDDRRIVRFEPFQEQGKTMFRMQVSAKHAHMSEEALRACAVYEFNRFLSTQPGWRLGAGDTKLQGLVLASHSLSTDSGYRDSTVWSEFLRAYNFPSVERSDVERAKDIDHHHYSGSRKSLAELRKTLPAPVVEAIDRDAKVGLVG